MFRFLAILLFLPVLAVSQTHTSVDQGATLYRFKNGIKADSALFLPRKDTATTDTTMIAPGMLVYRPLDSLLYWRKGNKMTPIASGVGDLSDVYTKSQSDIRFVHFTDTAAMLFPYLRKIDAVAMLTNYYTKSESDARYPLLSGSYNNPSWITSLAWSKITGTPTTLSGYGITDGVANTRSINTTSPLQGGGNLSADRTISIANAQADGENKGAATFRSDHFDDDTQGAISLDTVNGPYYTKTDALSGFIQNRNTASQTASFYITGNGTINNTLRVATTNTAAAPLQVGTLPSYANLSAIFEGNVQTLPAAADNQAVTLGQIKDSLNTKWSKTGDAVSSGQFIGSTNSASVVIKTNNDTAILANASKQVFVDTTLTMGDYVYDRKAIPGDPPHVFEVTSSGNSNYLAQFTNYSNTTGLANIHVRKARGTKEAPSAVQYGDALASFGFRGYGTANFGPSSGAFIWFARNNFTDSLHGTECQIQTTAVGGNAWYGRTYAFVFGADGSFTIPRGVTAAGDNNVATLTALTDYANSYLQFNNLGGARRGYVGMFGNTNQLTISADAGGTGTPTVRITNRALINTATDRGAALNISGTVANSITTITGNTTLTNAHSTVLANNSGSITITLPPAASSTNWTYTIKKVSAASNDVVIDPNGSELLDGSSTSKTLTLQWSSITIHCNGTSWFILSSHAAATTL